ncbi:MAG TPA: dihydroorotate dehydrogenase (quinone), partial [Candidatus Binataceae bacterium]|nr:dihydroorotate dehydrogenase (quinone) [Candidatus Binataceae bacterium]
MLDQLYQRVFKPIAFQCDPETAHRLTLAMLAAWPGVANREDPPELRTSLWNLEFQNPIGLAAGMDKDAVAAAAWQSLGFGFAELGTITPQPQPGNPRPRIFRIPEQHALVNRLGFPSDGMLAVAPRVARARRRAPRLRIAVNFGPNKNTATENVALDYAALASQLGRLADFLVINVSSPNTPGLRDWQSPARMKELFAALDASLPHTRRPPILLKVAPDLDPADLHRVCDTALELGLAG